MPLDPVDETEKARIRPPIPLAHDVGLIPLPQPLPATPMLKAQTRSQLMGQVCVQALQPGVAEGQGVGQVPHLAIQAKRLHPLSHRVRDVVVHQGGLIVYPHPGETREIRLPADESVHRARFPVSSSQTHALVPEGETQARQSVQGSVRIVAPSIRPIRVVGVGIVLKAIDDAVVVEIHSRQEVRTI